MLLANMAFLVADAPTYVGHFWACTHGIVVVGSTNVFVSPFERKEDRPQFRVVLAFSRYLLIGYEFHLIQN